MNPEPIFTYEKDGLALVGTYEGVAIKKNGLTINIGWEQWQEMAVLFQQAAADMERQNQEQFNKLFGGQHGQ